LTKSKTRGKAHYIALDGLRALAALAVLYLHELGFFAPGTPAPPALAVDFFFMLSGFVIAHAYGQKLDHGLTWSRYMAARLIRLYPMLFLGVVLGGLLSLARQTHGHAGPHDSIATFIASLFLLPVGLLHVARTYPYESPNVFLFNGILWSLFFAVVASAVYGTRIRHFSRRWLIGGFILCFVALVAAGIWAGSIAALGRHGLIGFLGGFPRVAAPFAIGVAIYSLAIFERFPRVPFAVPALVLGALLIVPIGDRWTHDLAYIFLAFPLLICFGAQSPGDRLCAWLGRLSYPLYVIQLPLSEAVGYGVKAYITQQPALIIAASVLSCLLLAWIAVVFYDEPVRRRLNGLLREKANGPLQSRSDSRYAASTTATSPP
jgi:peptidoglycan/LPS O-acetylase OafA/YrhL